MATTKPPTKTLTRLLDRTNSPVYLVSTDFVLVYANQACADWVGVKLELLIATRCFFSSQPAGTSVETRIEGLCPPPELMENKREEADGSTQISVSIIDANDRRSWRRATLHPFIDADQNQLGVLVICDSRDSKQPPDTDPVSCSVDPTQLHAALARIRTATDRMFGLESLVGTSPFANRLRRQVNTAIESATDLLMIGPRGSGKEHLARTIHSSRRHRDNSELLPIHCSIADQQLIQHNIKDIVASRTPKGIRTDTDGQDWLLLLDVDLLGEAAQNEILGFFQLPDFPLRTIATATHSLIELANQGRYSQDLAYHLSIMTIPVVPLIDRQVDVPFLAQALLERDNVRREKQLSGFSKSAMQRLVEFDWPDNIDQLNRTIQAAAKNAGSSQITLQDLPNEFNQALSALRIGTRRETEIQLDEYLGEIEKELISRALRQAKKNKTKAAKLLGVSRPKLLRRIQHFGLEATDSASSTETDQPEQIDPSAFKELD